MRKRISQKKQKLLSPSGKILRGMCIILLCCLLVRAVAETAEISEKSSDTSAGDIVFNYGIKLKKYSTTPLSVLALMSQSCLLRQNKDIPPCESEKSEQSEPSQEGVLYYHSNEKASENTVTDLTDVTENYEKADYLCSAAQIKVKNNPGLEFNVSELLSKKPDIIVSDDSPTLLIIHTHASEAYTPAGTDIYTESDPYRTEDRRYNVVALGDILTEALKSRGINVIHDRGIYDYPSYAGSYNRTYEAIKGYKEKYPSISMVIDLHRDASEVDGSLDYKTTFKNGDTTSSQVMLVVGSNASGLEHPGWEKNLQFAVHLQSALQSRYPGLARPISLSKNRYNQHATTGSLILEVGYCGNTLQEARNAVSLFADAAADVILNLK